MRTWTLLLAATLAACQGEPMAADALPADAVAPPLPQTMTLNLTNPLTPGWPVTVGVTGAQPNASLRFVRSNGAIGAGACPPLLNGGCLGITPGASGYQVINLRADAQGRVNFTTTLPTTVPVGASLVFQVVDAANATGSNTLARQVAVPACQDDNLENNDDAATATVNPANGTQVHACPGDDDVFRYTVPDSTAITIITSFDHAGDGDLDMELLDAAGAVLDTSGGTGDTEEVTWVNSSGAPAQVFLRAFQYNGFAGPADYGPPTGIAYDISASTTAVVTCAPDRLEPDSDAMSATSINPGSQANLSICDGDDFDWFSFNVQAGQQVGVLLNAPIAEGDVDIFLYGQPVQNVDVGAGTALAYSNGVGDTEQITFTAPQSGTMYLAVYLYGDRGVGLVGGTAYDFQLQVQ